MFLPSTPAKRTSRYDRLYQFDRWTDNSSGARTHGPDSSSFSPADSACLWCPQWPRRYLSSSGTCSNGFVGITSQCVELCCTAGCDTCEDAGCSGLGSGPTACDRCVGTIYRNGYICSGTLWAPCVIDKVTTEPWQWRRLPQTHLLLQRLRVWEVKYALGSGLKRLCAIYRVERLRYISSLSARPLKTAPNFEASEAAPRII